MKRFSQRDRDRIVWIEQTADAGFWDARWEDSDIEAKAASVGELVAVTRRFLPAARETTLLEGGCGNGGVVLALQRAGYSVTGVDFAATTVARLQRERPELSVIRGDVRDLSGVADASFDGYWSLGVIEHFWSGYRDILDEAHRVLRPGGYLFLTFPWLSPVRRLKAATGVIPVGPDTGDEPQGFYQFSLSASEVARDLEQVGFAIALRRPRSGRQGIYSEVPWSETLLAAVRHRLARPRSGHGATRPSPGPARAARRAGRLSRVVDGVLAPFWGHGYLIVARKRSTR